MTPDNPTNPRYRDDGTLLCHAKTSAGNPCQAPAMLGQKVCHKHGGAAPQNRRAAKLRLAALADPAIATLGRIMATAESDKDKLAAANSILDRTGYGRSQTITTDDARALLLERLLEAQQETSEGENQQ